MIVNTGFFDIRNPGGSGVVPSGNTLPKSSTWSDIAFGDGTFVAVSRQGDIAKSTDGITWTSHPQQYNEGLTCIRFGSAYSDGVKNMFIAGTESGRILACVSTPSNGLQSNMFYDAGFVFNSGVLDFISLTGRPSRFYAVPIDGGNIATFTLTSSGKISHNDFVVATSAGRGYVLGQVVYAIRQTNSKNAVIAINERQTRYGIYSGHKKGYDVKASKTTQVILTDAGIIYGFTNNHIIQNPITINVPNMSDFSRIFYINDLFICIINGTKFCVIQDSSTVLVPLQDLPIHPNGCLWTAIAYGLGKYVMVSEDNVFAVAQNGFDFVVQ